jgi:CRP-like cAMP-binding protein
MPFVEPLIARLESIGTLSDTDRALIDTLPITPRRLAPQEYLLHQGDRPSSSAVVLSGVLARFQELPDGDRQVVSFNLPGEIPDLHSLFIKHMDHSLVAITEAVVGLVQHDEIQRVMQTSPTLMKLLWRESLIDAAVFRQWIANNGRRGALVGTAHLLCELMLRAGAVGGLRPDGAWPMPFTQQQLGDALGLSLVHINRTLKSLREDNVASIERGVLRVLDWDRLKRIAGFDPTYLHLKEQAPAN